MSDVKKVKVVAYINGDDNCFYGAQIGDILVVSDGPSNMAKSNSIWVKRSENNGVFTDEQWFDFEDLCIANNASELELHFEVVTEEVKVND